MALGKSLMGQSGFSRADGAACLSVVNEATAPVLAAPPLHQAGLFERLDAALTSTTRK